MARERSELVNKALEILFVKEIGQAASDEDYNLVDDEVNGLLDDLADRNVTDNVDADAIDDRVFRHIATLLADRVSDEFGKPQDPQKVLLTEIRLREIYAPKLLDKPIAVDYF